MSADKKLRWKFNFPDAPRLIVFINCNCQCWTLRPSSTSQPPPWVNVPFFAVRISAFIDLSTLRRKVSIRRKPWCNDNFLVAFRKTFLYSANPQTIFSHFFTSSYCAAAIWTDQNENKENVRIATGAVFFTLSSRSSGDKFNFCWTFLAPKSRKRARNGKES